MNSSKSPDFKGIELKSAREKKDIRKGLFGKVPTWGLSKFKNTRQIVDTFGYQTEKDFRLYNTVYGNKISSQGLSLKVDYANDYLIKTSNRDEIGDFSNMGNGRAGKTLFQKHKETFWITAISKIEDNKEYFLFKTAEHTKNPFIDQFGLLIENGIISLDYNIKKLPNGKVCDKGCNFKLEKNALNLLFPPSEIHELI